MAQFQYALNASTIRPTPLLEKVRIASEVGYSGIELWHDDIDRYLASGGTLTDLRFVLDKYHLGVPTTIYLGGWFEASELEYLSVFAECRRRMEQAVALGAPYVIAGPPAGLADFETGVLRYRELLGLGGELGVYPAMEFLGFVEQLNTIEDALAVIDRSGHPSATTVLDPFHIFRGGDSVESIRKLASTQIAVSHFNDVPLLPAREQQCDSDRVMPGEGVFDLHRYLELLRSIGYEGWLSLELFRDDLWQLDPIEVAGLGLEKMRRIAEG